MRRKSNMEWAVLAAAFTTDPSHKIKNGKLPPENNPMHKRKNATSTRILSIALVAIHIAWTARAAAGYAFNQVVPDVRQPVAVSGGSACPVRAHQLTAASTIPPPWPPPLAPTPLPTLTHTQT